jgi:uncharacterized membrane protein YgdD (TMEM256/DUF423 family)
MTNSISIKNQLLFAGISAAIGVMILALAAHYLQNKLTEVQLNAVKTAANIQLIHSISIFALSNLSNRVHISTLKRALNFMIAGILAFSGSIYLLSLKTILNIELLKVFGPITPIGGVFLIISWSIVAISIYKSNKINEQI